MRLMDFIRTEAVLPEMEADSPREVVKELIDALIEAGAVDPDDKRRFVDAVMRRERMGTTGYGGHTAIPHAKHDKVEGVIGALGRSSEGVDFEALDGELVHLFFLVLSSPDNPEEHLKAMEHVFRTIKDDNLRRFMCRAATREELVDLLKEADEELD